MSTTYTQVGRQLSVHPRHLGDNDLILSGFTGSEAVSRPFHFRLQCLAENAKKVRFEDVLGQLASVRVTLPDGQPRWITGICSRVAQGARGPVFTAYALDVVPEFWFLSRRSHCRIFQHMTVVEILREVLKFADTGLSIAWEGSQPLEPREFCVQYRESDFAFASRLMEEEGLHYVFEHDYWSTSMHVSNGEFHDTLKPAALIFESVLGGSREEERILSWEKSMELKSRTIRLWDHCFELPDKNLEAWQDIKPSVVAGKSQHRPNTAANLNLRLFDYPGGYAKRFDGINKSGGEQRDRLKKLFEENIRTADLRIEEEASASILVNGTSNVRHLVSGRQFTLTRHFEGDGPWVLDRIEHEASESADVRSGRGEFRYRNSFTCFPADLPYRPPRVTPRPVMGGTQTAVVVGPKGQEVFTDKYGRVKVQFFWDPEGNHDIDSSCWIRVAQPVAGRRWGASFWPRVGQEVVVDFQDGDPDRPIIVGSVYNADQMPPYLGHSADSKHRNDAKLTGVKSSSTPGGVGFNEWRFDDTKGREQVFLHAERNLDVRVKGESMESVRSIKHLTVGVEDDETAIGDYKELVVGDAYKDVRGSLLRNVGGDLYLDVGSEKEGPTATLAVNVNGRRYASVETDDLNHVKGQSIEEVDGDRSLKVGGSRHEKVKEAYALEAGGEIHIKAGQRMVLEAGAQLSLKVGGNFVDIGPAGVAISGTTVLINSGGAPATGCGAEPEPFEPPPPPDPMEKPEPADSARTGFKSC